MSTRDRQRGARAEVVRATFISAGRHHPQFMRPFELNATEDSIEDILLNLNNRDFETDSLGGWVGDVINCVSQVDGVDEALVPHGWDGDRLRFFMHVQVPDRMSSDVLDFYVTGFTENDSLYEVEGGDLQMEDDTRLFINSVMRIRRTSGRDLSELIGGSTDDRLNIEASSHCLIAYTDDDRQGRNHNEFQALRPYDVVAKLDSYEEDYTHDSRSDFSTNLTKSSARNNVLPSNYIGRTVKALHDAERESYTRTRWRENNETNSLTHAQRLLNETDQSKCKLLTILRRQTSYLRNGFIRWDEAKEIFDGIEDERYCTVMRSGEVEKSGRTSDLDGERLHGSDMETTSAYTAMNSITGIMMECCVSQAHFQATTGRNGEIGFTFVRDTAPVFFIGNMTEEQEDENLYLLEKRLRQFVFEPLEFKVSSFDLEGNMDVMGDSQFFLSIQGDKEAEFWGPSFADGSTSSLLSSRKDASRNLANDTKRLSDALIAR